ncbi:hypothetical protein PLICRDRAFT_38015 [Plicaturopsis crispa FD-325 SS-3]|nr:hypothetical protein PLICRDRAFT_38015 [Plicaturopsis crispa FD-325 SS-3]
MGLKSERPVRAYVQSTKEPIQVLQILGRVFLPAGYPHSVSPDYLHYQIFNSLQAFSSSLAGLIASRAILEGFGVGDSSASATQALLFTALQDIFSRLTTIVAAYYVGTSLFPEAKRFRLLADVLNDAAIALDSLSPLLNSTHLGFNGTRLRVVALCLSGSLRALCGVAAGGSKAALALHFASPQSGIADIGDLSAKDGSKETVLALSGLLLGTLIVPYLATPRLTYTVLFALLLSHLTANYIAVRGVVLRSLNRQRTSIAWTFFRESILNQNTDDPRKGGRRVLRPDEVAHRERIFDRSSLLRDIHTGKIGSCTVGSSFSAVCPSASAAYCQRLFDLFKDEKYILCVNPTSPPRLHICLKEGYTNLDQVKAWAHALEAVCPRSSLSDDEAALSALERSYAWISEHFPIFVADMDAAGWNTAEGSLSTGQPKSLILRTGRDDDVDAKKILRELGD